jgi:stage V sporulation protein SpoVS
MILGKTGAEEVAGAVAGVAELKLAADVGLTGAEAINFAFHR